MRLSASSQSDTLTPRRLSLALMIRLRSVTTSSQTASFADCSPLEANQTAYRRYSSRSFVIRSPPFSQIAIASQGWRKRHWRAIARVLRFCQLNLTAQALDSKGFLDFVADPLRSR